MTLNWWLQSTDANAINQRPFQVYSLYVVDVIYRSFDIIIHIYYFG